ncbi:MAG TPA: type II secretion system protein [Candidatus Dojkabacteria bacterium]|nr:type II secretion system protein [Candidatus Dojkabacteria bacterium]HQF36701.1 type II secretion system protein [Candidatus Dojkabacteria bacterium]
MKRNYKTIKYLSKKNKAFTLIEVLISVALIAVMATAYLELMISIDKRSTKLEIEDTAQSIAIESINSIRKIRLDADGWNDIVETINSGSEFAYKYDFNSNSFVPDPGKALVGTGGTLLNYSEFNSFCTDPVNEGYCDYSNESQFRRDLSYGDVFSVLVSGKRIDDVDGPRLITIYVGCNPRQSCDTFVKLSTVVYHY